MEHEEFVEQVQLNILRNHALRLSDSETIGAIEAVLQTLAEQITQEDRATLVEHLPPSLQHFWRDAGAAKSLTLDGFFERIAERLSVDLTEATYYARAVLSTLSETLTPADLDTIRAELPAHFNPLFQRGQGDELDMTL